MSKENFYNIKLHLAGVDITDVLLIIKKWYTSILSYNMI